MTDYPDADLITNLSHNIDTCAPSLPIVAKGYLWGADPSTLVEAVKPDQGFDVLILADLLFNHSEHGKLVESVKNTLKKDGTALVFFTPYRPWLLQKDLAFFDLARENGFVVDKVLEKVMDKVMFEEDPGVSMSVHQRLILTLTTMNTGRALATHSLWVRNEMGMIEEKWLASVDCHPGWFKRHTRILQKNGYNRYVRQSTQGIKGGSCAVVCEWLFHQPPGPPGPPLPP